jgi:hypothetical protein
LSIDAPAIDPAVESEVLAFAGVVAHTSQRKFAPLASFAAGIAVGRLQAGGQLQLDRDVATFLADLRTELEAAG